MQQEKWVLGRQVICSGRQAAAGSLAMSLTRCEHRLYLSLALFLQLVTQSQCFCPCVLDFGALASLLCAC